MAKLAARRAATTKAPRARVLPAVLQAFSRGQAGSPFDPYGFVLREGMAFTSAKLTENERTLVTAAMGRKRFQRGKCFYNAQRILDDDASGRLVYVEGYALVAKFPVHHGWLALGGKVIDPTDDPMALGAFPAAREYHGVLFDRAYVQTTLARRLDDAIASGRGETVRTLLDDWEDGHPIVRKGEEGWRYVSKRR